MWDVNRFVSMRTFKISIFLIIFMNMELKILMVKICIRNFETTIKIITGMEEVIFLS